jgi:hypothetical protein
VKSIALLRATPEHHEFLELSTPGSKPHGYWWPLRLVEFVHGIIDANMLALVEPYSRIGRPVPTEADGEEGRDPSW